ncbi:Serine/threonine protein kinase [Handroanthus impetiginosus]|uniref:Serine/threonine protein kinase n=1 Tax=Handroanthus impetiginosus TaxID=429701 RepID=A0A2G9GVS7_9LAMI|nr:Serine/threonine protein kinase [Handroanthus impetiginosus]
MSAIYDNWERLVAAVLKREELWQLFHSQSRSPSVLSEASDFSSSFSLGSPINDLAIEFSSLGSSSRLEKAPPKLVLISDFSPAVEVNDLHMASAKLLGRGTFGSTYMAVMDNGVKIVVKRLKSASISEQDFKHHMDIIGNVRHENVAPLRAYYSSKYEQVMLYDYYSEGSVYALLQGRTDENRARVDLETRLRIAIGAARGIAEIHRQNGGKLVHGNIKSSNIFLGGQRYGSISDLGLASMIKTKFTPTIQCYAPEVKSTRNVSQASDVYSFGILLLELLTGESTTYLPGAPEPINFVKLVGSVKSKEKASGVFDPDRLKHHTKVMVEMLQIGLKCVARSIKERPLMTEVVNMLEDIIRMSPEIHCLLRKELVFLNNANPAFDFKAISRARIEFVWEGTFGFCCKAILFNEKAIVMKRFIRFTPVIYEFQRHMEVIGRMGHENVYELRAYYFSPVEKILVYDYYNQGSVSALLHGEKGTNRTPLDWETRLKIAVGAARGIAHIHRQCRGKLVHGNVKSSNIFVNEKKYGCVSHVGLAKFCYPTRPSTWSTWGYVAPEFECFEAVSQASDVYSFGVVLLELISGKQSYHITNDGKAFLLVDWVQSVFYNEWTTKMIDLELRKYQNDEEAMMQVFRIAMDCVAIIPERRPKMREIVKMLEGVSGFNPSSESRLEYVSEECTRGEPSIESRLEDLLEGLFSSSVLFR